jgi:two-component system, chemotaxis family, protein-glutamate methylesterase/glutaminase
MRKGKNLLVIGASAGGTAALPELIAQLTPDMPVSVMVVLHLSKASIGELLVNRLQRFTELKCKLAAHGESIKEGHIYVAVPDHHLIIKQDKMLLGRGPLENRYRPSIDALFRSAAVAFGPTVIGVILTGMLEDGASGMYAIRKSGGICIIQDPEEARYPGMPQAVLNVLKPDYIVSVSEMGEAIRTSLPLLKKKRKTKIPEEIVKEAEIAERVNVGIGQLQGLGKMSPISCPDCGGTLWELKENGSSRYRCHVGHAFSEEGLITSMEASTEATLWIALRMIEERKNLLYQVGERESKKGKRKLAATYFNRSDEMEAHAKKLKDLLFNAGKHQS